MAALGPYLPPGVVPYGLEQHASQSVQNASRGRERQGQPAEAEAEAALGQEVQQALMELLCEQRKEQV